MAGGLCVHVVEQYTYLMRDDMKTFKHKIVIKSPEECRKDYEYSVGNFYNPSLWVDMLTPIIRKEFGEHTILRISFPEGARSISVRITMEGERWNSMEFNLAYVPWNYRLLWSYGTWIDAKYRGKGFSYKLMKIKEYIAKIQNVDIIMASTTEDNAIEKKVLEASNFICIGVIDTQSLWLRYINPQR